MSDPVRDLPDEWRERAEDQYSPEAAAALEDCARELEAALGEREIRAVTLREAVEIGGYSYSRLQELVGDEIENVGEKGAPRIRYSEVPIKPGHSRRQRGREGPEGKREALDSEIADIRDRREGVGEASMDTYEEPS